LLTESTNGIIIRFKFNTSINSTLLDKAVEKYFFEYFQPALDWPKQQKQPEFGHAFCHKITQYAHSVELVITVDHAIVDGHTCLKLVEQLAAIYNHLIDAIKHPLPIQPKNLDSYPSTYFESHAQKDFDYWANFYKNNDNTLWHSPPKSSRNYSDIGSIRFHTKKIHHLKTLCKKNATTPFLLLSAIFGIVLSRLTHQKNFFLTYPVDMRPPGFKNIPGCYINTILMSMSLHSDKSFASFLQELTTQRRLSRQHQNTPFHEIVKNLRTKKLLKEMKLSNFSIAETVLPELVKTKFTGTAVTYDWQPTTTNTELNLLFDTTQADSIYFRLDYQRKINKAFIQQIKKSFLYLLEYFIENPEAPILKTPLLQTLPFISPKFDTQALTPLPHAFEAQSKKTPEQIALCFESITMSYKELNSTSNQLAHFLISQYSKPLKNQIIAICAERSPHLVIGILGILKAGAAYLPLDPNWPQNRINDVLSDSKPILILSEPGSMKKLNNDTPVLSLRDSRSSYAHTNPIHQISIEDSAYVLYTSGTTGAPKGVVIKHKGLSNAVMHFKNRLPYPTLNSLGITRFLFDIVALEFWLPLISGGQLRLFSSLDSLIHNLDKIQSLQPLFGLFPVSVLRKLIDLLPHIEVVATGGEPLDQTLTKKAQKKFSSFFNLYGPTETTVYSSIADLSHSKSVHIGKPILNTSAYILDEDMHPLPIGAIGELYLGGFGVAQGYLNNPELTAKQFLPNPFATAREMQAHRNTRIYKTGDLVRWLPSGNIEYIGRIDSQIKLRGLRIELSEVEAHILKYPGITQAAVILTDQTHEKTLIAYYVSPNATVAETKLQIFLNQHLPNFMVPSHFISLQEIPVNKNGKLDRKALPAPSFKQTPYQQPQTLTELKLSKIWQCVLALKHVNRNDNFFHIGGHSLLAIQLAHEINQTFNKQYNMSFVFEHKQLQEQALMIDITKKKQKYQPIKPLNQAARDYNQQTTPLILVHPGQAQIDIYGELVSTLPSSLPIFGVDSYNFHNTPPIDSLKKLAHYYVKALHKTLPADSYILCGWSLGGCLAFEMAKQMSQSLDKIKMLIMIDSFTTANMPEDIIQDYFSAVANAHTYRYQTQALPDIEIKKRLKLLNLENQMMHAYQPKPYPGNTLVINSINTDSYAQVFKKHPHLEAYFSKLKQTLNGWQHYLPNACVSNLDYDHYQLIQGSGLDAVSKNLKEVLMNTFKKDSTAT